MRKIILSVLGASVVAVLAAQTAVASESHHARKTDRATASEQFRNSNAYAAPAAVSVQPDWSQHTGISAPAGH